MRRARQPERTKSRSRGFSLIELLVTITIFSVLGLAVMKFFGAQLKFRSDTAARSETHQGLNAAFDSITRDIRLAGACLPIQPQFVPIVALNRTTGGLDDDTITLRTGKITNTTTCPASTLSATHNAGNTPFAVTDISGFVSGGKAWLQQAAPAAQVMFDIVTPNGVTTGVAPAGSVTPAATVAGTWTNGTGIYSLEERIYSIDRTNPAIPTLMLSIDGDAAVPVAAGIRRLNLQYKTTPCPPCTDIDAPTNAQWLTVTEVLVTLEVQSVTRLSNAPGANDLYLESATVNIQPRNIITYRAQ